ncbi:hypothetical protein CO172_00240 [Candidatus Uhrbacteria bacterium CG_4_9_14_3_um_filter_36_7]|uniref:Major facilitator superfamily (MFS) profile domain-containing protein n=1 Tax=Candidatus Uhrbacteria bacterium CG_4_9_14_3_um_filter_36_7 TaxID=1975033 RepID=A0A2M7XIH9_9BACT|nr:MAG: hypothetical protein CO172_00240 [Candidatus Uhrbacteria bacterium CG_4_9_14_3_um_filter_36_7]
MRLKPFLIYTILITLFFWLSWGYFIFTVSPEDILLLGLFGFYFLLGCALLGIFFLFGILGRRLFRKHELFSKHIAISFRQGFLFTFLFLIALFLQSKDFLTWLTMFILVVFFSILELLFLSITSTRH